MNELPLVRAVGVSQSFGHGSSVVVAVHGVSCALQPGDQVALTGPSGSGKTTLLHLLAGLGTPTTGFVDWPAIGPISALRPGPVSVVFQAPSLLPALDVLENVALPLLLQGSKRSAARADALAALRRLGISDLAPKVPDELSGGQAQRVAVARSLAGRPRLVLADEPTGQLDHANGLLVVDALVDTARELGAALVLNTHDRALATHLSIHWSMVDGRLRQAEVVS